jgi:phosphoribosylaminoimidazole-succinocarboxamide synthase
MKFPYIKSALPHPFTETDLPIPGKISGKVRDIYQPGDGKLLMVTTDRLSAFDRVLGADPFKGQILNQLSAWWFDQIQHIIPSHLLALPDPNALIAKEVEPFPIEVIVRGYITGVTKTALWYRYDLGEREIYGHHFPDKLTKNQKLPKNIITPTTKGGQTGHDERLTCAEVVENGYLNAQTWKLIQEAALAIFELGQRVAENVGLILVDTKYEFGHTPDGQVLIIDEVHTPDSSRYWKAANYHERVSDGLEPENFDKEFIRLEYSAQGYRGEGQPPDMPDDLWIQVAERYITLYENLTGKTFEPGQYPIGPRLRKNVSGQI